MNSGDRQAAYRQWRARFAQDVASLSEMYLPGGAGLRAVANSVQSCFGTRASKALTDSYAAGAARERTTGVSRILVPTAGGAAAVLSVPSRAHTFYGD